MSEHSDEVKLNLGCGPYKLKGFINIDISDFFEPDVIANVLNLPYEKNSVDVIYAGHLVEHLEPEEVLEALRHWKDILKPGGNLYLTFPDYEKAFEMWMEKWIDWRDLNGVIFGLERPIEGGQYVYHRQLVSINSLAPFLQSTFGNYYVEDECEYVVARVYWQSTLRAVKGDA